MLVEVFQAVLETVEHLLLIAAGLGDFFQDIGELCLLDILIFDLFCDGLKRFRLSRPAFGDGAEHFGQIAEGLHQLILASAVLFQRITDGGHQARQRLEPVLELVDRRIALRPGAQERIAGDVDGDGSVIVRRTTEAVIAVPFEESIAVCCRGCTRFGVA